MIIQAPYKVGDVVSIKVSSGEEMIARLEEENDNYIVARKPLMLVANQQGMGLAPFMFTVDSDAKFKIRTASIICIVKSAKEAVESYTKSTSGLTVA
jgi:hypothetical protein